MKTSIAAAALGLGLVFAGAASAAPAAATTPAPKLDKAAIEARSQQCRKEAEVRGLHGKEFRKFKEECKRAEK